MKECTQQNSPLLCMRHDHVQDRIGRGLFYHPKKLFGRWTVGAVPDFAWGMFASIPRLRKRLAPKWAGQQPPLPPEKNTLNLVQSRPFLSHPNHSASPQLPGSPAQDVCI